MNVGASVSTLTGAAGPPLTLVSPTFVLALGNLLPIVSSLQLNLPIMMPEPSALLLIGTGIVALALTRCRRK